MTQKHKGLLEALHIRLEKDKGEALKKSVQDTKAILDSIGTVASVANTQGDSK